MSVAFIPYIDYAGLTKARARLNMSQHDLALMLDVSPVTVSRWENGHIPQRFTTAVAIAAALIAVATRQGKPIPKEVINGY